jgi:hypothetical protein
LNSLSCVFVCYCRLKWEKSAHTDNPASFRRALATVDVAAVAANPLLHTHLQCAHPQRISEITSLWFAECVSQLLLRSSHRIPAHGWLRAKANRDAALCTFCNAAAARCTESAASAELSLSCKPPERFCALICFRRCHQLFVAAVQRLQNEFPRAGMMPCFLTLYKLRCCIRHRR